MGQDTAEILQMLVTLVLDVSRIGHLVGALNYARMIVIAISDKRLSSL